MAEEQRLELVRSAAEMSAADAVTFKLAMDAYRAGKEAGRIEALAEMPEAGEHPKQ